MPFRLSRRTAIVRNVKKGTMPGVFVLGLGAQKCGTSWLYKYLRKHSGARFSLKKEYDALEFMYNLKSKPDTGGRFNYLLQKLQDGKININKKRRACWSLNFILDPTSYFAHFYYLLQTDGCKMVGDITPSYADLSEEALTEVKQGFERCQIEVKPIFLMRDPVYRLQSAVGMNLRNKNITPTKQNELNLMNKMHLMTKNQIRSGYDKTLARLFKVFGQMVVT